MLKKGLTLLVVLVIGIMAYNYFMGTEQEKEQVSEITKELKDVALTVKNLLKSEKEKFDGGKYDAAIDKIGDLLKTMGEKAKELGENFPEKLKNLEDQKTQLEDKLQQIESATEVDAQKREEVNKDLEDLYDKIDNLTKEMNEAETTTTKPGKRSN